jgi:hypothetical protein
MLRAQWHKRKTGMTAFLSLSQADLRDLGCFRRDLKTFGAYGWTKRL